MVEIGLFFFSWPLRNLLDKVFKVAIFTHMLLIQKLFYNNIAKSAAFTLNSKRFHNLGCISYPMK